MEISYLPRYAFKLQCLINYLSCTYEFIHARKSTALLEASQRLSDTSRDDYFMEIIKFILSQHDLT